jgi:predicted DNA-binding protein (MmcQ/YjbR family)
MDIETFREYCLSKKGTTEETPFGPNTLVFKVLGKMFAACEINSFESINLKCDPEIVIELREEFPDSVLPGYHMNKKHWNTVLSYMPDSFIQKWTDHSYELVVASLPQKIKKTFIQ